MTIARPLPMNGTPKWIPWGPRRSTWIKKASQDGQRETNVGPEASQGNPHGPQRGSQGGPSETTAFQGDSQMDSLGAKALHMDVPRWPKRDQWWPRTPQGNHLIVFEDVGVLFDEAGGCVFGGVCVCVLGVFSFRALVSAPAPLSQWSELR